MNRILPNWIVDVTNYFGKKIDAMKCYESQISDYPGPRSIQAVEALAKFRGTRLWFWFWRSYAYNTNGFLNFKIFTYRITLISSKYVKIVNTQFD